MPADHKVSVAWQIVFMFIPIVDFWAFYRVRKLRRFLLYVILPQFLFVALITLSLDATTDQQAQANPYDWLTWVLPAFDLSYPAIIDTLISWAFLGFSIYLIVKWSRQHNEKYDKLSTPA